jgi:peroxiredoxin (alkyl hydroperoxide reductase subunit C)
MGKHRYCIGIMLLAALALILAQPASAELNKDELFKLGDMDSPDSHLMVKVGQTAPDFSLPAIDGSQVSLSQFLSSRNVVISFVPAAWTPICSEQWPDYNQAEKDFAAHDTVLLGISVDNLPSLFAWDQALGGLWFPVLSDFWPHGEVARKFGVLRGDGMAERALFVIDRRGVIRYIDVHDANQRPDIGELLKQLQKLN